MSAFPLNEFLAGKVERSRRLLAESEEYTGSADLQVGSRLPARPLALPPRPAAVPTPHPPCWAALTTARVPAPAVLW